MQTLKNPLKIMDTHFWHYLYPIRWDFLLTHLTKPGDNSGIEVLVDIC